MPDIFDQIEAEQRAPAAKTPPAVKTAPAGGDIFDQIEAEQRKPAATQLPPDTVQAPEAPAQPPPLGELGRRLSPTPAQPEQQEVESGNPPQPAEPHRFVGPVRPPAGAEQSGLPGVPSLRANVQPVPLFDKPKPGPWEVNAKTGMRYREPGLGSVPILDSWVTGPQRIIQGSSDLADAFHAAQASDAIEDPAKAKEARQASTKQAAAAMSNVLSGALELYTPALIGHLATAPIETGLHVAGGMIGQQVTEKGLVAAGVPKEYAGLAGDLVLIAGVYGGVQRAKAKVDAALAEHNRVADTLLESERSGGQVAELTDSIFKGESYPTKIDGQPATIEYQGASRKSGRGFWRVVNDADGKELFSGTGNDVQGWLRTNEAIPQHPGGAPEAPPTEISARRSPTTAAAIEQARPEPGGTPPSESRPVQSPTELVMEEARERLGDIQAMEAHLKTGEDVQMSPLTMEHTTPAERR
jgi:hypothetical protein